MSSAKPASILDAVPAQPDLKQKALGSLSSLPPFSPILTRLLAVMSSDDVSFGALSDLIEKDTVVAGNILRLVNSALYARRGTVSSVRHAVSLLGATKVRNVVLAMSLARMWNRVKMPETWSMARFNMHSAAVAVLSDLLAQRLPVEYPEGAFVAGLLHDTGRLLIALALSQEYERILELYAAGDRPMTECELEILGFTHAELSADALKYWNLPQEIQTAVGAHHGFIDPLSAELPLSRLVCAANQYTNSAGLSILAQAPIKGQSQAQAPDPSPLESLGLDQERLQPLLAQFRLENDAMAEYFR
ncbi:MAG TPA: HDOD domain-containing protein [Bryobacteraceae bacterium]|jgi:HD-like signal output (HDOD) protein